MSITQQIRNIIREEYSNLLREEGEPNKMGIDLMNAKALLLKVASQIKNPSDRRDLHKLVKEIERIYTNSTEISI